MKLFRLKVLVAHPRAASEEVVRSSWIQNRLCRHSQQDLLLPPIWVMNEEEDLHVWCLDIGKDGVAVNSDSENYKWSRSEQRPGEIKKKSSLDTQGLKYLPYLPHK